MPTRRPERRRHGWWCAPLAAEAPDAMARSGQHLQNVGPHVAGHFLLRFRQHCVSARDVTGIDHWYLDLARADVARHDTAPVDLQVL